MKIGGYQIIDLENRNFTIGVGMQYKGLYEKIEGTRKPTLVSGVQIGNTEYHDMFITFVAAGSTFVGQFTLREGDTVAVITITVSDLDIVTITIE